MKRYLTILLLLSNIAFSQGSKITVQPLDDKFWHMQAGSIITNYVGTSFDFFTNKPGWSMGVGFLGGVTAGGLKETYDLVSHKGTASWADFAATSWGSAVGSIMLRIGLDLNDKKYPNRTFFENLGPKIVLTKDSL